RAERVAALRRRAQLRSRRASRDGSDRARAVRLRRRRDPPAPPRGRTPPWRARRRDGAHRASSRAARGRKPAPKSLPRADLLRPGRPPRVPRPRAVLGVGAGALMPSASDRIEPKIPLARPSIVVQDRTGMRLAQPRMFTLAAAGLALVAAGVSAAFGTAVA